MSRKYDYENERKYESERGDSTMGRSIVYITCPFCQTEVKAFMWSLAGCGKLCPKCGAKHDAFGNTSPRIDNKESSPDFFECQCNDCKKACGRRAGWFLPGEAEKAAEFLNMPFQDFFDQYLGVDYWNGKTEEEDIYILAPIIQGANGGEEYPFSPIGECVFFEDGLCKIHPVKPHECAALTCNDDDKIVNDRHKMIAESWQEHQVQIKELLGRDPREQPANIFSLISMLTGF